MTHLEAIVILSESNAQLGELIHKVEQNKDLCALDKLTEVGYSLNKAKQEYEAVRVAISVLRQLST